MDGPYGGNGLFRDTGAQKTSAQKSGTPASSSTTIAVSTLSIIHLTRLTVCLPHSLDLDPLPIDFILINYPRLYFCYCCRNVEFTITICLVTVIVIHFESTAVETG